jgi:phosphoglycolate phosphatase
MLRQGLRAAIVDLDGTMVNTLGDFHVALNRSLSDLDLPAVDAALVERTVGKGSEHLILSVLQHQMALPGVQARPSSTPLTAADPLYEAAWQRYQHHYLAINGQFANVYPGVVEGLQMMRDDGLALACLTNKPLAFARQLLQVKGLDGFFMQVFGGDSFECKKPDPLPVLKTCEALGALPVHTLMLGDSSNDAQAAHAAGCPVVLVRYGYNHGLPVDQVAANAHWDRFTQWSEWKA